MNAFVRTGLYNFIFKNYSLLKRMRIFDRLWNKAALPPMDMRTELFGTRVTIPSDYALPLTARAYNSFNNPYLELVYQCYKIKKNPLTVIDVGACVGDTFLFIMKNTEQAINKIICVEGHPDFQKYLLQNTKEYPEAIISNAILSDKEEKIRDLVKIHESTASAQGDGFIQANTLDHVLAEMKQGAIDVLKIDVDGFDGKILAGARGTISNFQPHIIFEYHPGLIQKTGNDLLQPFIVLAECGYIDLLWYDKYGVYSHSIQSTDTRALKRNSEAYTKDDPANDLHYDVVAIPPQSAINKEELQKCIFSTNKKYPY